MGRGTELVFVEGHSTDDTYATIERAIAQHPERQSPAPAPDRARARATRCGSGFERASGDVLMILDADLTVAPEDLPRFLDALQSGKGEFINGVRLVYPMEKQAMRFFNLLGQQVLQPGVFVAARPVDQGHAVRHQSAVGDGLPAHRRAAARISATSIRSAISTCCSARRD